MTHEFVAWINDELDKRRWSYNELARRAGLSSSSVSMTLGEQRNPGITFCHGIAKALGLPPERVFRKAGLLPPQIIGEEDHERKNELLDYYESLDDTGRDTAVALIRTLYEQRGPYVAELRPNKED